MLPCHHPIRRQLQAQVQRQLGQGERSLRRHRVLIRRQIQVLLFKHHKNFPGKELVIEILGFGGIEAEIHQTLL